MRASGRVAHGRLRRRARRLGATLLRRHKLSFRLDEIVVLETVGLAMQSAIEHVATADGTARGAAVATNVFLRTPSGWRMVCHHASPMTSVATPAPSGPLH